MKSKTLFYLILLTLVTSLIPTLHAQTFSVLYRFTGGADGANPAAGVAIRGNALYGTTSGPACGTVYQLTHSGSNWLFSTLAALGSKGCTPYARVVFGPDGHLYGTSSNGGKYGGGAVFKLTPQVGPCKDVACYRSVTDLYDFGSGTDGQFPSGELVWDQQGNVYGTTSVGGTHNEGTVFELMPSGNGYTESVLYNFSDPGGIYPYAGLVWDNKGNLFGTATAGGSSDVWGTVFELTYVVGVGWTEHVLYNFQDADDGGDPTGGLIFDSSGNLYGTTADGGSGGGGTVFELSPSGDTWTFKVLYSFSGQNNTEMGPWATLSMDGAGNLYGTTHLEGIYNSGNVFKLSNTQNGWVYTSLYDFTGGTDGGWVLSNVSIDTDGTLYGTAASGGNMNSCYGYGCGTAWMIKP
jgi:uncharacterized repeat protein (TIGR03803 family)